MEIKQRFVLGAPAPLATGVDIAADNISATNVTTTNLAATNITVSSTATAAPGVIDASAFPGADAGAKIANAIATVSATGGTVDARGIAGAQTFSANPFATITAPLDFVCAGTTFTLLANVTIPANVRLIAGEGCVFALNGHAMTVNGPMDDSSTSPHFSGSGTLQISRTNNTVIPSIWSPTTIAPVGAFQASGVNALASGVLSFGTLDPPQNPSPSNALIGFPVVAQFNTAHPNSDGLNNAGMMGIQGLLVVNNTSGTNGNKNAGVFGDCEVTGAGGVTGECYGGIFFAHISSGTVTSPLAGVKPSVQVDGGTVSGIAAAISTAVNQTAGSVGTLAGIIVNSIAPSGGTTTKIIGLQINDMGQANIAFQVGNADNKTGLSTFTGSVGIFGNGGEFNDNALLRIGPLGTTNLSMYGTGNISTVGTIVTTNFIESTSQRLFNVAQSNWTIVKNVEAGGQSGYGIYATSNNPDFYMDFLGNVAINSGQVAPRVIPNRFCVGTADQFQVTSTGTIAAVAGISVSGAGVLTHGSVTFATLPASPNGSAIYCSDCNATCTAGGSTGRTCFREAGAWTH